MEGSIDISSTALRCGSYWSWSHRHVKPQAFVFAYTLTELIYMLFIISSSCEIVSGITEDIIILASVRPQYDKSKKISSVSTVVSQQADPEFNSNTIWPGCVTVQEIKRWKHLSNRVFTITFKGIVQVSGIMQDLGLTLAYVVLWYAPLIRLFIQSFLCLEIIQLVS